MSIGRRLNYYNRIASAYLIPGTSQLTFWHEPLKENLRASSTSLGEYYMDFPEKAAYSAHLDSAGIPRLNYRGRIGVQYNPIAISQWGLGNFNLFCQSRLQKVLESQASEYRRKFLAASDWLCSHLERNSHGIPVWNHYFGWEYRDTLTAPWYSGLAQGQGISLLVRAYAETGMNKYMDASAQAFKSFMNSTKDGGILYVDEEDNSWFEEYIVDPPTHILNGFIWASWGVFDYFLATKSPTAEELFTKAIRTLRANLDRFDLGFWSLYEHSGTRLQMVASSFYHQLHIVQLRVMHRLTGDRLFADFADRWQEYSQRRANRIRALCYKSVFKICYY